MRISIFAAVVLLVLAMGTRPGHAIGCLSGPLLVPWQAIAGHAVLGAASGCIAGHEWHKHQLRQQDLQPLPPTMPGASKYDPNYQSPFHQ